MYESLLRPQEVAPVSLPSIETAVDKLRKAETSAEERRIRQIETAKVRNKKRKRAAEAGDEDAESVTPGASAPPNPKKRKDGLVGGANADEGEVETSLQENAEDGTNGDSAAAASPNGGAEAPTNSSALSMAHSFVEVRGHTSYLTFAVLLPSVHITRPKDTSQPGPTQQSTQPSAGNTTATDVAEDYAEYDHLFKSIPDAVCAVCPPFERPVLTNFQNAGTTKTWIATLISVQSVVLAHLTPLLFHVGTHTSLHVVVHQCDSASCTRAGH